MFIDPLDLGSTVLYVCVLFPGSEIEGLPRGCDELCTVWIGHVATSQDVVHVEAKDFYERWLFVIGLVGPGVFIGFMVVDQEAAGVQWVDSCSESGDGVRGLHCNMPEVHRTSHTLVS